MDASLVGKRVRMWWGGDDAWYTGRVAAFDAEIGGHTVKYDDGEEETYAMTNEKVRCAAGKRCYVSIPATRCALRNPLQQFQTPHVCSLKFWIQMEMLLLFIRRRAPVQLQ